MSYLRLFKKTKVFQLCFMTTFITSGIIINFVQCILYLFLKPLNKPLYRKINWYLCATINEQLAFLGDYWADTNLQLYVDRGDYEKYWGKEHAYCIINHAFEIDWYIVVLMAEKIKLVSNCKAYVKKSLQYLPVLGWSWKFSDFVILERSFDKDKEVIYRQIKELVEYADPMWLMLFPEGTRFTPQKFKTSVAFAKEKNLPQLKYHLQPRTRGFITSLPSMKDKVPAIYDILVMFNENDRINATAQDLLAGNSVTAHIYMRRIPMTDVPSTEAEQEMFLRNIFVQKDKMRESFEETGNFFATSGVKQITPFKLQRRIYPILNMTFWSIVILYPITYYIATLLLSGNLINFSIGIGIILFFIGIANKLIGSSKIDKGSLYGTAKSK